jgi:O-antigen/teichoic acid export membrane protein
VRRYYEKVKLLAFSGTAKDTYILFGGNVISAFLGFIFILFAARALSVSDFGVFSAVTNLMTMALSVGDIGLTSGLVNFVSEAYAKGEGHLAGKYIKSALLLKFTIIFAFAIIFIVLAPIVSPKLLATSNPTTGIWLGVMIFSLFFWSFFPSVLQARKNFFGSISIDLSYMVIRLISFFAFGLIGISLYKVLGTYVLGGIVAAIVSFILVGTSFLKVKVEGDIYKKLLKFSGWLGVNRIISSVSGGLDIQMLAVILGATATGLYSVPSRLASFVIVLSGSFSSVLATRMAGFGDREKEKTYLVKAILVTAPIIVGIILWIILAKPFILILFGTKYLPSVGIFQALAAATIPFVIATPSVSAIIYSIKQTKFIGIFSFFQLAAIFTLNTFLIPKFGVFGPTITLGIANTILAIYSWVIVIRHYWFRK